MHSDLLRFAHVIMVVVLLLSHQGGDLVNE